jgi:SNF2 family DNA or RNA helicase
MTIQERSACIANFQKHQGKIVLIAMKQCISVGLNLTQANHVILLSEWWNFTLDRQCIARIYRIGQTKPVYVHKLMSKVTIDERIRQIAAKKEQEIATAASYSDESNNKHADKYLKQTSLADYGYLLNLSE